MARLAALIFAAVLVPVVAHAEADEFDEPDEYGEVEAGDGDEGESAGPALPLHPKLGFAIGVPTLVSFDAGLLIERYGLDARFGLLATEVTGSAYLFGTSTEAGWLPAHTLVVTAGGGSGGDGFLGVDPYLCASGGWAYHAPGGGPTLRTELGVFRLAGDTVRPQFRLAGGWAF